MSDLTPSDLALNLSALIETLAVLGAYLMFVTGVYLYGRKREKT